MGAQTFAFKHIALSGEQSPKVLVSPLLCCWCNFVWNDSTHPPRSNTPTSWSLLFLSILQELVGETSSFRNEGSHAASVGHQLWHGASALLLQHWSESGEPVPDPGLVGCPPASIMCGPDLVMSGALPFQPVLHNLVLSSVVHVIQAAVLVSGQHWEHSVEVQPSPCVFSLLFSASERTDSKHSATRCSRGSSTSELETRRCENRRRYIMFHWWTLIIQWGHEWGVFFPK